MVTTSAAAKLCGNCGSVLGNLIIMTEGVSYCTVACAVAGTAKTKAACALGRHIVNIVVVRDDRSVVDQVVLACHACDTVWDLVSAPHLAPIGAVKVEVDKDKLRQIRRGMT